MKRAYFGALGRSLALVAAALMCVAALHDAAHIYDTHAESELVDHQGHGHHHHAHVHDHGEHAHDPHHETHDDQDRHAPLDCSAFHLVAATSAAPTGDIPIDLTPQAFAQQRMQSRASLIPTLPIARRALPRGPPFQSDHTLS
ncbi:MAG: hypothetical protein AAGC77_07130 [Pseudomonadota bacterium]